MFNFQLIKYPPHEIHYCKRCLYTYIQYKDTTVPDYHKSFIDNMDIVEHNRLILGVEK